MYAEKRSVLGRMENCTVFVDDLALLEMDNGEQQSSAKLEWCRSSQFNVKDVIATIVGDIVEPMKMDEYSRFASNAIT